jgi:Protein of unknown function (DUF732)
MLGKLLVPALLLGAMAAAAPAAAAPAAADGDSMYFDFLRSHGVSVDQPGPLKITASEICQGFDDGMTFVDVGNALMQRGADPREATIQIFGAVEAYCPVHDPLLNVAPTTRLV